MSGAVMALLLLAGCAQIPSEMRFLPAAEGDTSRLWPALPEVPRYSYVGELTGETNFGPSERSSPGTAERRFAVTINLNDDYDGGGVVFPEYGPDHYRPEAGGILIFSCSLIHEALPVTRGRRFALLNFARRRPTAAAEYIDEHPDEWEALVEESPGRPPTFSRRLPVSDRSEFARPHGTSALIL